MQKQKIAVIGAGIGGLAAAALLQQNHDVTLYEKFDSPKPVGAGLLLQPTGLAVLERLGLSKELAERGAKITRLHGKTVGSKFTTLDVHYGHLAPELFGVGTYRPDLFNALYKKVREVGVTLCAACDIVRANITEEAAWVIDAKGKYSGPYDLIIDASGMNSKLRGHHAEVIRDVPYPFGAIWSIVEIDDRFRADTLHQRYRTARHMIGLLPVGMGEHEKMRAAFFWSLPIAEYATWRVNGLETWRREVLAIWPELEAVMTQFTHHDNFALATYRDVVLKKFHSKRIAFLGDAAHCTSPQLGQGANLALVDAVVLSRCLHEHDSMEAALAAYTTCRKNHVRFYQTASRFITPLFQSSYGFFAWLRGGACCGGRWIPGVKKYTAQVLTGGRTGWISQSHLKLDKETMC